MRLQPLCRGMSWELTAALAQGVTTGGTVGWLRSSWLTLLYSGDCLQTTITQADLAVGLPTGSHMASTEILAQHVQSAVLQQAQLAGVQSGCVAITCYPPDGGISLTREQRSLHGAGRHAEQGRGQEPDRAAHI